MENITLKIVGKPDLSFVGTLAAHTDIAGSNDKFLVFETSKGHWLVARVNAFKELQSYKVIENKDEKELINNLNYTDEAKNLYRQLDIEYTNKLDI